MPGNEKSLRGGVKQSMRLCRDGRGGARHAEKAGQRMEGSICSEQPRPLVHKENFEGSSGEGLPGTAGRDLPR